MSTRVKEEGAAVVDCRRAGTACWSYEGAGCGSATCAIFVESVAHHPHRRTQSSQSLLFRTEHRPDFLDHVQSTAYAGLMKWE